jgi:hypothetical protein
MELGAWTVNETSSNHCLRLGDVIRAEIESEWRQTTQCPELTLAAALESWCASVSGFSLPAPIKKHALLKTLCRIGWPNTIASISGLDTSQGFDVLPGDPESPESFVQGIQLKHALLHSGFSEQTAIRVRDALQELHNNAIEHSDSNTRPLFGFVATSGSFEMGIVDVGIGILSSLKKSPIHVGLKSDVAAVKEALRPGISRYNGIEDGRGYGFVDLLNLLTRQHGEAYIRSGCALYHIDNTTDTAPVLRSVPSRTGVQVYIRVSTSGRGFRAL